MASPMSEQAMVRRAKQITLELEAVGKYTERVAAERRGLIRQLVRDHGWSQHRIAAELEISQPAVSKLMRKEAGDGRESA